MQKAEGGLGRSSLSQIASANQKHKYFTQENFPGCDTYLAPQLVVTIFIFVGIIFIPLGIAVLVASKSVVEIYDRYDTACLPEYLINDAQRAQYIWDNRSKKICTRTLRVPKLMRKPIYVYYQLENFYQNHRRFITSRSDEQLLQGIYAYPKKLHNCEPLRTYENRTIIPCGLVAWSLFNDTYKLMINDQELDINKKEIAWESDRKERFGRSVHPENFLNNIGYGSSTGGAALSLNKPVPITVLQCNWQPVSDEHHYKFLLKLSEDQDLMVWMNPSPFSSFRKLYGQIDEDIPANTIITIIITNVYNTYSFHGRKTVVLSTANWLGGKNDFLGSAALAFGTLSMFFALAFFILNAYSARPIADPSYLSWNTKSQTG